MDPDQTKRRDGEPSVEKARISSLSREPKSESARAPPEPIVLRPKQLGSETFTPQAPDRTSVGGGATAPFQLDPESWTSASVLRPPVSCATDVSETHSDPKQLRKLRQQQLQQKFKRDMEAKKLQQNQDAVKTEAAVGPGPGGGQRSLRFLLRLDGSKKSRVFPPADTSWRHKQIDSCLLLFSGA